MTDLPLHLVNDALGHTSAWDYGAAADAVRPMVPLDSQQRSIALTNVVHVALMVGELVSSHGDTADDTAG